jgi:hypothetical protein
MIENEFKTLLDRPNTTKIAHFDRMVAELSKWMTELEIDTVVNFMDTIQHSQWDINPTVEDSATQLKLLIGNDRYQQIKHQWSLSNQTLLKSIGAIKYRDRRTGEMYDGLDSQDKPEDYEIIYL